MSVGTHISTGQDDLSRCWHKDVNDEGFCKSCGVRAAIKIEGLHEAFAGQRGAALDMRSDGDGQSDATKQKTTRVEREQTLIELFNALGLAQLPDKLKALDDGQMALAGCQGFTNDRIAELAEALARLEQQLTALGDKISEVLDAKTKKTAGDPKTSRKHKTRR